MAQPCTNRGRGYWSWAGDRCGRLGAIAAPFAGGLLLEANLEVSLICRRVCNAAGFGCICRALHIASSVLQVILVRGRPTSAMVVSTMGREGDAGEGKFLKVDLNRAVFG